MNRFRSVKRKRRATVEIGTNNDLSRNRIDLRDLARECSIRKFLQGHHNFSFQKSLLLLLLLLFTLRKNGVEIKFSLHSFIFAIPFPLQTFSIFPRLSFPCLVYLRWRFCLFTTELFAKLFESAPKFSPMFSRTAVSVSVYDQYSAAGTREEFVNDSTPSPEAAKKSRSTTVSVQGRGE